MRANESGPERESRGPHVVEPQPGGDPTPSREPFRSRLRKGVLAAAAVGGVLGGSARYVLGLTFPTPRGDVSVDDVRHQRVRCVLVGAAARVRTRDLAADPVRATVRRRRVPRRPARTVGPGCTHCRRRILRRLYDVLHIQLRVGPPAREGTGQKVPSVRRFEPRGGSVGGRGGARHRIVPRKDRPSRQGLDTWIYETSP